VLVLRTHYPPRRARGQELRLPITSMGPSLTGSGWFSCSWKLPEGRIERCRASVCTLAAVDKRCGVTIKANPL